MKIGQGILDRKRVISAMLQREAKSRFGSNGRGLLMAFFEPLVLVIFFGAMFIAIDRHAPHGSHIIPFMLSGVLTFHLFSKIMGRCMSAIDSNKTLLSYPIVQPIDPILARAVLESVIYVTTFVVLMVICQQAGLVGLPPRFEFALLGLLCAVLIGLGLGAFFAAMLARRTFVKQVVPVINRAGFLTSGAFFSASMIPQFAREVFLWNPMLNVTEMVRYGLFPNYPGTHFDVGYVLTVALCCLALGLTTLLNAQNDPKARIRGAA